VLKDGAVDQRSDQCRGTARGMRRDGEGGEQPVVRWVAGAENRSAAEAVDEERVPALVSVSRGEEMEELEAGRLAAAAAAPQVRRRSEQDGVKGKRRYAQTNIGEVGRVRVRSKSEFGVCRVTVLEVGCEIPEAAVVCRTDKRTGKGVSSLAVVFKCGCQRRTFVRRASRYLPASVGRL
jgi:hypothetical protein